MLCYYIKIDILCMMYNGCKKKNDVVVISDNSSNILIALMIVRSIITVM